jgi:ACS family sodium-dependent inorganic phosphate cotransporter-like MFS transporter 5
MGLFEFSWSGTRCGCSDAGIVCRRGRPQLDEEEVLISVNREQEHRKRKKRFILCKDFFPFVPARGVLAVMTFLGTFVLYALRINLSVAIVAMTNATSDKSKEVTNASCNPTAPVFQWDNTQQALILSAFFYAYPLFQLPGGYISTRLSAKYMIGVGIFVASILSLLTPLAVTMTTSIAPLVTVRVLQGLAESACMPSFHSLVAKWAPPLERSRMTFISGSGVLVGCSATLPLAGWLCNCGFAGGWPSVFYVSGIAGVLWFVLWLFLVYDTPGRHPRISLKELKYIQNALADQQSENIVSLLVGKTSTVEPC